MQHFRFVLQDQKEVFHRWQTVEGLELGLVSALDQWSSDWELGLALKPQTELVEACYEKQLGNP
jgi:hypothetical protein